MTSSFKLKTNTLVTDLLTRLEDIELREELHDMYAQNVTFPTITNQGFANKFGTLTKDQLGNMVNNALSSQDLSNTIKLSQLLFGSILSAPVRLSTFLSPSTTIAPNSSPVTTTEYYSNYVNMIPLREEITGGLEAGALTRDNSMLIMKNTNETRAYVRTKTPNLYISGVMSGNYKGFLSISNNPLTEEGRKVKGFSSVIKPSLDEVIKNELATLLPSTEDKTKLNSFISSNLPVFQDAISLALVDVLNQGTYASNYGSTNKAGEALVSNNFLSDHMPDSLLVTNPEIAESIKTKLAFAVGQRTPYMVDIRLLHSAQVRARSSENLYVSSINTFSSSFQNLISAMGKALGNPQVDFDDFFTSDGIDNKKQQFLDAVVAEPKFYNSTISESPLRNAFLRLVSKHMGSGGYVIMLEIAHGITFNYPTAPFDTNTKKLVVVGNDAKSVKPPYLKQDVHDGILNKAGKEDGRLVTKDEYARVFGEFDTKSDTQQNISQGRSKSAKEQMLSTIAYLFNPDTQEWDVNKVLFAAVPSLIVKGALYTSMKVTDAHLNTVGSILNNALQNPEHPNHAYSQSVYQSLVPFSTLYNSYMNILLNFDSSYDEQRALKEKFINLCANLANGIWSEEESFGTAFGIASGINPNAIRSEIQIAEWLLSGSKDISQRAIAMNANTKTAKRGK